MEHWVRLNNTWKEVEYGEKLWKCVLKEDSILEAVRVVSFQVEGIQIYV